MTMYHPGKPGFTCISKVWRLEHRINEQTVWPTIFRVIFISDFGARRKDAHV